MSRIELDNHLEYDPDTKAWFAERPVWTVTTVSICPKCGRAYKPSLGHKPKNCVSVEVEETDHVSR